MKQGKWRKSWLALGLVCGLLCTSTKAEARTIQEIHTAWESLMGNNLLLSYYCLGTLGDFYRHKLYPEGKTKRYIRMLRSLLNIENYFLKSIKVPRGKENDRMFGKIRAVNDLLTLALNSLYLASNGKKGEYKKFLIYRNSAAKDIGAALSSPALKKRRIYPGGWRRAMYYLGHYLGKDLVLGYLLNGLVMDGFYRQLFKRPKALEMLRTNLRVMKVSARTTNKVMPLVNPKDQVYVNTMKQGAILVYRQAESFQKYLMSRNKAHLAAGEQWRRKVWAVLNTMVNRDLVP